VQHYSDMNIQYISVSYAGNIGLFAQYGKDYPRFLYI
jgi:hypothetical protein